MKTSGQNRQKVYIVTYLICVIQVYGASLTITQYPQYPTVSTTATLTCHIPLFTTGAEWLRNGVRLLVICLSGSGGCIPPSIPGYQFSADATTMNVTILSLNIILDDTTWTCKHAGTDIGYINLKVYNPVGSVQVKNGTNVIVIESQSAVLVCETDSCRPSAAVYWMKNDINITDSYTSGLVNERRVSIGTLNYTGQKGDNGSLLTCGAFNGLGSVKTSAKLIITIYYPPSMEGLNSSYKVIENEPLNVTCQATSNPPADLIFWSPRGEGSVNSTLYFRSVSRNNSGNYSCTAQNTMRPTAGTQQIGTNTSQITVDVLYGASISNLSLHGSNTINENSSANFNCHVDSNPPSTLTWMKEGSSAVLKTESGVVQSNYTIKSAECLDMGNYTCTADNGIWTKANGSLELFVRCHPRTDFRLTLETKIYKKHYEAAILRYRVISYPPPTFTWTFLGNGSESKVLPVSASQHDNGQQSELRITNLDITDFGNYSIIANNSLLPSAVVVFEIIQSEPDVISEPPNIDSTNNFPLAAVAGSIGAGVGVILVVVLVVLLVRRYRHLTSNTDELVDNPVYDMSGPLPGPSATAAKANKPKKKASNMDEPSNIYAQVNKTKKNFKKGNTRIATGDIYKNAADLVVNTKAEPSDESLYEDAGATGSNGHMKNKDGLHYADLMLGPQSKKNGKDIIRGIENRTEYAEIAYGKRGEPLPDSDN